MAGNPTQSHGRAQQVPGARRSVGSHGRGDGGEFGRVDLHPFAPHAHQSRLRCSRTPERRHFRLGEPLAAERRLPRERHELVEPEPALRPARRAARSPLRRSLRPQSHALTRRPPARKLDPDARFGEGHRVKSDNVEDRRGRKLQRFGTGRVEHRTQFRGELGNASEPG